MEDDLYAVRYLKLFLFRQGELDLSAQLREIELGIMDSMDVEYINKHKNFEIKDMTSLTRNQVKLIDKLLTDGYSISLLLNDQVPELVVKLKREIKLNQIFKGE